MTEENRALETESGLCDRSPIHRVGVFEMESEVVAETEFSQSGQCDDNLFHGVGDRSMEYAHLESEVVAETEFSQSLSPRSGEESCDSIETPFPESPKFIKKSIRGKSEGSTSRGVFPWKTPLFAAIDSREETYRSTMEDVKALMFPILVPALYKRVNSLPLILHVYFFGYDYCWTLCVC